MQLPFYCQAQTDETLYSVLARTRDHSAIARGRTALEVLCGSGTATPILDLPVRLESAFAAFGAQAGYLSIDDMVERATLLPYYRPFMARDRWQRVVELVRGDNGGGLKIYLGLVANRIPASPLRSCEICDSESWRQRGVVFWHRAHQLPGMSVCSVHLTALEVLDLRGEVSSRMTLRSPSIPRASLRAEREVSLSSEAIEFSKLSVNTMTLELGLLAPLRSAQIYREMCRQEGLIRGGSQLDWRTIGMLVSSTIAGVGEVLGSRGSLASMFDWLRPMLHGRDRQAHPMLHLLFLLALYRSADTASAKILELAELVRQGSVSRPVANVIAMQPRGQMPPQTTPRPVGQKKPKALYGEERRRIVTALSRGDNVAAIAKREKFSASTIYRVLRETPDLIDLFRQARFDQAKQQARATWTATLNDKLTLKLARNCRPHVYAWLYRNDRDWLQQESPVIKRGSMRPIRVDWSARDDQLASFVSMHSVAGSTSFAIFNQIAKSACAISETMARTHRNRLPKLWAAIRQVSTVE